MSYKDMLVALDAAADSHGRIELAAALAERFAAHLVALFPVPSQEFLRRGGSFDTALV